MSTLEKKLILLLEINEVPWRVINEYANPKFPHLFSFFKNSKHSTTIAVDSGELSPWVTWPTLHRGIPNDQHGIKNLGQDPASFGGKPIWDHFLEKNLSVGLFGSFQSWPPKNPGKNGFYVPDCFAADASCFPESLRPILEFNLQSVKSNGRVVQKNSVFSLKNFKLLGTLFTHGMTIKTVFRLAIQLFLERLDSRYCARRPIFQTVLFFDVFKKLYNPKNPPEFTTFFTNHIAGVMHRYWDHIFPSDFPDKNKNQKDFFHRQTMDFAMKILNEILEYAVGLTKINPKIQIIFASSMGQAAIQRDYHEGFESILKNSYQLVSRIAGVPREKFSELLAMVPQNTVVIDDPKLQDQFVKLATQIKTASGKEVFQINTIGKSITITTKTPSREDSQALVFLSQNEKISWNEIGITHETVDPGTAYHIVEGSMMVYSRTSINEISLPEKMLATEVKPWMMKLAGL